MIYLFLLLIQSIAWSAPSDLGQLINQLDDLEIDPKCKSMSDNDLALYCAEELCGKYKNDISVVSAKNYHMILTPAEVQKVKNIPQEMRAHLENIKKIAKQFDEKALAIKNGKASAEELKSNYAKDLVDQYPLSQKVEKLVKERLERLPDQAASCQASVVLNLINDKRPKSDLVKKAAEQYETAVFAKLSTETAQKLRAHLKNNVKVYYEGLNKGSFDVSYYPQEPLKVKSVEDYSEFARKIHSHVNEYSCNSELNRRPMMLLTDSVGHDEKSKEKKSDLYISPYSCTHGISTENIIAHEVGHIITYYISNYGPSSGSKKKFLAHRECIKQQGFGQPDKSKTRRFSGDHTTTEEDHADALAFEMKNKNTNLCAMLASDGKEFINLDYKLAPTPSHSPSLLRIMRDYVTKGVKLPDTCRELAKRNFPQNAFHQCSL